MSGYAGFPVSLLPLLRCPHDGGDLVLERADHDSSFVLTGHLRCRAASHVFAIAEGIVAMLEATTLDDEERAELAARDDEGRTITDAEELSFCARSRSEIRSTLAALTLDRRSTLVELACGKGRFTFEAARRCGAVVAVDFSRGALEFLARRPYVPPNIGLVHADIKTLRLAPRAFDRALSTTPLDGREQRLAMHRLICDALTDAGVYAFSTEYHDLKSRLLGLPRAVRYTPDGMLYFRLRREEAEGEAAPYFGDIRSRLIDIVLPFVSRLEGDMPSAIARAAQYAPGIRQLANLLLVTARRPIRPLDETTRSPGSRVLRVAYRRWSSAVGAAR
jgi:SAM-dependent methyltransferase